MKNIKSFEEYHNLNEAIDGKWKKSDYPTNKIKNKYFDKFQDMIISIQKENIASTEKDEFDFIWGQLVKIFSENNFRDSVWDENKSKKVNEGLDMRFKLLEKARRNHTDTEILDEIIRGMSDEDVKLYLRDII